MKPTEILSSEHRVIEQVLDCLERVVNTAEMRNRLDGDDARAALGFLRTFADGCHHAKEERQLFPKMTERGIPRHAGPLAVMLGEHDAGRAHVAAMAAALDGAARGEARALARFVTEARAYVALLREHIAKEDHVLFPMAEACFRAEDRAAVLAAFERVESNELEPGTHEAMLALADRLAERHGVTPATAGLLRACASGPLSLRSGPRSLLEVLTGSCSPRARTSGFVACRSDDSRRSSGFARGAALS
jgi:hemerythrin-like domain-containing protein